MGIRMTYKITEEGIVSSVPFPEFLYDVLTEEQLIEVRKFFDDRFAMGYWYRGTKCGD